MTDRQRSRLWPLRVLASVGIALWLSGMWMHERASATSPHRPDPATDHVYALGNHGFNAYVTRGDYIRIEGTKAMGWVLATIGIVTFLHKTNQFRPRQ